MPKLNHSSPKKIGEYRELNTFRACNFQETQKSLTGLKIPHCKTKYEKEKEEVQQMNA